VSIETHNGVTLLTVAAEGPALASEADALDLIGQTYGAHIDMIVLPVARLSPDFFRLSTQLAGHFFQKMQNYRVRLAIVGDLTPQMEASTALTDFVGETNRVGHHLFVPSSDALLAILAQRG
jgi:hypothetical protein